MGKLAWNMRACMGRMSRLQMSLAVAFVLVMHGARWTMATAADNISDVGGGLIGAFPPPYSPRPFKHVF